MLDLGDIGVLQFAIVALCSGLSVTSSIENFLSIDYGPIELAVLGDRVVFDNYARLVNYPLDLIVGVEVIDLGCHL
jgi:hypothetical protein